MKCLCTSALIALVAIGWAAQSARGQNETSSTLLPWPSATPTASFASATYYSNPQATPTPAGTLFTGAPETPTPQPTSSLEEALHSNCGDESCQSCNPSGWFAGVAVLAMGRTRANPYWTTYQTNNNPNQLMNTQNAGADWAPGGQFVVGYNFCGPCGPSVFFTYWGLAPMDGFSSVVDQTGNINTALSTPINLGFVTMNSGLAASQYFDNAHEHRIWRRDIVNNFELNAMTGIYQVGSFQMAGLAGFRYFRFAEDLTFGSVAFGSNFGDNGGADEAYLKFRTINNLYGGQVGALINWMWTDRLSAFLIPKFGIFGNQMNCQTLLYTGDAVNNPTYNITAHKTDIALLAELDAGFSWLFANNWRGFIGYRLVGVNNIALADNQFLPFLADTAGFAQVKQDGSLILHGAFAGVGFAF
jgi:hypothetical protein